MKIILLISIIDNLKKSVLFILIKQINNNKKIKKKIIKLLIFLLI
jgi:hypothetical protein